MDTRTLKLRDATLRAIGQIQLKLELSDKKRFRASGSLEAMRSMLLHASQSQSADVRGAYEKFSRVLTERERHFFCVLDVDLEAIAGDEKPQEKNDVETKKQRVYRGQTI